MDVKKQIRSFIHGAVQRVFAPLPWEGTGSPSFTPPVP
jgi:hypothetical protein